MPRDPFGNLREWGCVLDLLDTLRGSGHLAECQRGLCRILRFRGNWRLREEVLQRLDQIEAPNEGLIEEVINVVADEHSYHEVRILACQVLPRLVRKTCGLSDAELHLKTRLLVERLESLRKTPRPPILRRALDVCLESIA